MPQPFETCQCPFIVCACKRFSFARRYLMIVGNEQVFPAKVGILTFYHLWAKGHAKCVYYCTRLPFTCHLYCPFLVAIETETINRSLNILIFFIFFYFFFFKYCEVLQKLFHSRSCCFPEMQHSEQVLSNSPHKINISQNCKKKFHAGCGTLVYLHSAPPPPPLKKKSDQSINFVSV